MPAEGVLSASALAPTAALADALATAFYVLGTNGTGELCSKYQDVGAILLVPGAREGTIDVHTWSVKPDQWRLLADEG
jgi:thiamine biosynthesis lipoprotein